MSGRYDVAVIGAGHNGLAVAAYLALSGRSVVVLERCEHVGGLAHTVELGDGRSAPGAFPSCETLAPEVIKELALKRHGLVLSERRGTVLATAEGLLRFDGRGRHVGEASTNGAGGLAAEDAAQLAKVERFLGRVVKALSPLYRNPLPELETLGAGDKLDLLRIGWRLRRLGRRDMREAMAAIPMSMRDFVEDRLDGAAIRALLAGLGSPGGCLGPYAAGTVFRALHDQMSHPRPLLSGPVFPRGGMGAVGVALAGASRAAGAEVRTEAEVAAVAVDGGRVRGVTLATGEHLEAGTVVSAADPRRTLLGLVDPTVLDPEQVFAARGIRASAGVASVTFVLGELPQPEGEVGARELFGGRVQIGATVADIERAFDGEPAGRLPERPFVQLVVPTLADETAAAGGGHVAVAWVQSVPRVVTASVDTASGDADGWGAGRETLAAAVLDVIDEVLPGFRYRVNGMEVTAPPDFETRYAATNGCLFGADLALDQALYLRPLPGWSDYRTPVRGLYQCGSGTHGGGGITGLAGRNAARRIVADGKAAASRERSA